MMLLLLLLGIAPDAYWAGFTDGAALFLVFRYYIARYTWKRKCKLFKSWVESIYPKLADGAASPYEIDLYKMEIDNCWCLSEFTKLDLIKWLDPIRKAAAEPFQSNMPAAQKALNSLVEFVNNGGLEPSELIKGHRLDAILCSVLHSGWFGKG